MGRSGRGAEDPIPTPLGIYRRFVDTIGVTVLYIQMDIDSIGDVELYIQIEPVSVRFN
jgi:hypothetical protein